MNLSRLREARRLQAALTAALALLAGSALVSRPTQAQVCAPSDVSSELAYLRRLSLDLRGHAPAFAELESLATSTKHVGDADIDAMLSSDEFVRTMRGFYRDLLSVNLAQDFVGEQHLLVTTQAPSPFPPSSGVYWNPNRARLYRGGNQSVPCRDEPATFDAGGAPVTKPDTEIGSGAVREGWVLVHPYWSADPAKKVKVCAFDAQTSEVSSIAQTLGQRCDERNVAKDCGCGPDGRACQWNGAEVPGGSTNGAINRAVVEQAMRMFERVVREDRPYSELVTSDEIEIDGPIAHWLRYQSRAAAIGFHARPDIGFPVPDLSFTEESKWVRVKSQGNVAGVLTSPFYLVKYSSNRGRANRFYNAFLCSWFSASPAGLPDPSDACTTEPNITKRCGCKDCHASLEPSASHWGRWAERGVHPLPASEFPKLDPACAVENPPAECADFRLVSSAVTHPSLEPYKGMLKPYVFAEPYETNIEAGPAKIAGDAVASGQLAACTTRRLFTRFVGRAPHDWPDERADLDRIAGRFASGYSLRALARDLVTMPQYRGGAR